ncbi:uncharacterized protein LOC133900591 [Phragmites australis]|uniref:uncharacterized protein LOC133900591 n=1 Tax=Phragmites australis TaxID=29695 RepID=UPI002D77A902|nr:uncharacterized protein LOC133900591 [Phragmites australis]
MGRPGELFIKTKCGDGKLSGDGGAEYPCVRRFRHRRLITFLWLHGFESTVGSMLRESDAIFSVRHLQESVVRGLWHDALGYLSRFLTPETNRSVRLSVEAVVLQRFLGVHGILANILDGCGLAMPEFSHYLDHGKTVPHGAIRLRSIILNMLHSRLQIRASLDWERVRYKAAEIVHDLAYRTPELKDLVFMPGGPMKPHNVLPIGFGFRQRRHQKKQDCRPRASALAKHFLQKRRSLPASSSHSHESIDELLTNSKALNWALDIVDESLKAGKRPYLHQAHPLQTSGKEGATVPLVSQTTFGSLAGHAKQIPGMPSVAKAGKLASHAPTSGAPLLGTMLGAPVLQTTFGSLTSHCQNSGTSLTTNACATATPVSTMFATLTGHAKPPGMPSVANAGALAAPVTQTTNLTSHAENSESSHQGFNPKKNPREELTTSDEQDLHLKRQRTTGDFGEASLVIETEGRA